MSSKTNKYRLVTRNDFDGLVSSMLLSELRIIDSVELIRTKDIQSGTFVPSSNDILVNLPYNKKAHLVFDYKISEMLRICDKRQNHIIVPGFSSARAIYDHFGGKKAFPYFPEKLLISADDFNYARFSMDEILHPKDWVLLNFLIDHRSKIDLVHSFKTSHEKFFENLKDVCINTPIKDIMNLPYVKERAVVYFSHQENFKEQLKRCTKVINNITITNFLEEDQLYVGNRFMTYAIYPKSTISVSITKSSASGTVTFSCGKSIINRGGSVVNIGDIMRRYNGGGHSDAGAFRVDAAFVNQIEEELIRQLTEDV